MKYLYGASVQGIQDFIFKTNKLQEIVGASEIVKSIQQDFVEMTGGFKVEILMNAAGNTKALFEDEDECRKVVLLFGKKIQQKAYGITLSQAVVKIDGDVQTQKDINTLEKRLKIQRNKPSIPLDMSINIMKLNPSTAKPSISSSTTDKATSQKLEAYRSIENKENTDLQKLSNSKNKLAVIHIDGNGLGQLIPKLKMPLSEFSVKLDKATKEAFEIAKGDKKLREIILGGDDVTIICNANDALNFTKEFLSAFEENTEKELNNKLTACAGIAYTNEKYPFHYAVELAETLCGVAKKHSKKLVEGSNTPAPSSLLFYNIQSSNFQSWDKFVEDELTIRNDKETIRCDFGPYYLSEPGQPLVSDFINTAGAYACDGSPVSRLRAWLGELYKSDKYAKDMLKRINEMAHQSNDWNSCIMEKNLKNFDRELSNETLIIGKDGERKTPIYDVLQILSVTEAK